MVDGVARRRESSTSTRCWASGARWTLPAAVPKIVPIRSDYALPRYLHQRLGRKRVQHRLFRGSVIALQVASRRAGFHLALFSVSSSAHVFTIFRSSPFQDHQRWTGLSDQEALIELLRCQDLCALQPQHLADYDIDKLRVTKGGVLPKSEGPITPYWDPTLRRDARQRVQLFHKLAELKILSFRTRAFAGLFFVEKGRNDPPHRGCPAGQPLPCTSTTHITRELVSVI